MCAKISSADRKEGSRLDGTAARAPQNARAQPGCKGARMGGCREGAGRRREMGGIRRAGDVLSDSARERVGG